MRKSRIKNCSDCKFFVPLSSYEKTFLDNEYAVTERLSVDNNRLAGACLRHERNYYYLLIQGFIFSKFFYCDLFEKGRYIESWDFLVCPKCSNSKLRIRRQIKDDDEVQIFFECDNFIDCRFDSSIVTIERECRYCGVNLKLEGGSVIKCYCPKCRKSIEIPITLKIWPELVLPVSGCVHIKNLSECKYCRESRNKRLNLLEIELPAFFKHEEKKLLFTKTKKTHPHYYTNTSDNVKMATNSELYDCPPENFEYFEEIIEEYDEYRDFRDYF